MGKTRVTSEQIQRELAETAATLPIYARLPELFTDKRMFDSYKRFGDEGFRLAKHAEHKIMAGSHKSVPDYLFKKYNNDRSGKDQISNYMLRIEGARLLRSFIAERGFSQVIAPRKWLYELPDNFPERFVVVVERVDLASEDDSLRRYEKISKSQLRELATVLYYFRGLNSTVANLPFTEDGLIAFIDTERWANGKDYLRKVGDRLPSDRRRQAEDIYEELRRQGARPFRSEIKWSRRAEKAAARGERDFDSEEDTSSSSWSS